MSFTKSMLALAVMAVSFTSHAAKQADLMIVDGTVLTIYRTRNGCCKRK